MCDVETAKIIDGQGFTWHYNAWKRKVRMKGDTSLGAGYYADTFLEALKTIAQGYDIQDFEILKGDENGN